MDLIKQVELFVIPTNLLPKDSKFTVLLGHFTTKNDLGEQLDARILMSFDPQSGILNRKPTMQDVKSYSVEELREKNGFYSFNNEGADCACNNINELLRVNKKIELYDNDSLLSDINAIKVESLEQDCFSYLFVGYVYSHLKFVKEYDNTVFYNNAENEIVIGEKTHHVLGNNLSNALFQKAFFGFGQKKMINYDCSLYNKRKLEEFQNEMIEKLNNMTKEEITEEVRKKGSHYFGNLVESSGQLSDYFYFLKKLKETNIEKKLWLNQSESDIFNDNIKKTFLSVEKRNSETC